MPKRKKPITPINKSSSHAMGWPNAEYECQADAGPPYLLAGSYSLGFPGIARTKAASQLALFGFTLSLSFPETPRTPRSMLSPQHLRQRITEILHASPLGRFFSPSDSPKSCSARKWPSILKKENPVVPI